MIPTDFSTKKIMTPGPVPLPDYVKKSLYDYECHHRMAAFSDILLQVFEDLKKVFQTQQHCYVLASTGTGGLEASFVNTVSSQDKILYINAGKFGERWGKIAQAFNVPAQEVKVSWGDDVDLNRVEDCLKKGDYRALAFQACETSTGALLPVRELCNLAQKYNALSMVDGITALGAISLPMDKWGIDVLIGGSQKAFMLPTGLSFLCLSERAESVQSDIPSFYFNLKAEKKQNLEGKTCWSTPTHPVLALSLVLDEVLNKIGMNNFFANIQRRADHFREQVALPQFPKTCSPSLSCIQVPEGRSAKGIVKKVYQDGYMIVAGQDQLEDKVLRVGHMGDMSLQDLTAVAESIKTHLHA